jgi:cytochrome c
MCPVDWLGVGMDSFEFNKVAGAVLMTVLIATVIGHVGDILVPEPAVGKTHLAIAGLPAAGTTEQAKAPAPQPLPVLLAKADVKEGAKVVKACETCHNVAKGKGPKIGPDLWGVVGRKIAGESGFQYSDAIKKLGGDWTFEKLDDWIAGPQKLAPGTKMTYAGLPDAQKRADLIAFLNTQGDKPQPLPKVTAEMTAAKPVAAGAPPAAAAPAKAEAGGLPPIEPFLAKANLEEGKKAIKKCEICHNVEKGKGPKIGPDLWGAVGRKVAGESSFQYSDALKKLGGEWTFDKLNAWIDNPRKLAPGTKMTFAGVKSEQERADIIAYLNSRSDKPLPLPK